MLNANLLDTGPATGQRAVEIAMTRRDPPQIVLTQEQLVSLVELARAMPHRVPRALVRQYVKDEGHSPASYVAAALMHARFNDRVPLDGDAVTLTLTAQFFPQGAIFHHFSLVRPDR